MVFRQQIINYVAYALHQSGETRLHARYVEQGSVNWIIYSSRKKFITPDLIQINHKILHSHIANKQGIFHAHVDILGSKT